MSNIPLATYLFRFQNYVDKFCGYPLKPIDIECTKTLHSGSNARRYSYIWQKYYDSASKKPHVFPTTTLLADIDTIPSTTGPRTIRDYVDTLMERQGALLARLYHLSRKKILRTYRDDTLITLARQFLSADAISMVHKFWLIPCGWQIPPRLKPMQPNGSLTPRLPH